jgi:hypothetical protein
VTLEKVGRRSARYRSADELTGGLFSGDFEIVSAPGAVPWEITAHRAAGKGEQDKNRADNLSHGHKSPSRPPNVDTIEHLGRMFDTD